MVRCTRLKRDTGKIKHDYSRERGSMSRRDSLRDAKGTSGVRDPWVTIRCGAQRPCALPTDHGEGVWAMQTGKWVGKAGTGGWFPNKSTMGSRRKEFKCETEGNRQKRDYFRN